MNRMDGTLVKRVVGALAALVAVAAFVPAVAWAQVPVAQVTMYEVLEALQFKQPIKHTDPQAFAKRFAEAGLLGNSVQGAPGTVFGMAGLYIEAAATSTVNINPASRRFGTGPIQGTFDLLVDYNSGDVDHLSDLAVVASGRLRGTLDLRPALDPTNPQPIAPVSGKWSLRTSADDRGQFQGAFLIAVDGAALGLAAGDWYVQPAALNANCVSGILVDLGLPVIFCKLAPTEYVLGIPLTKAVIYLFE